MIKLSSCVRFHYFFVVHVYMYMYDIMKYSSVNNVSVSSLCSVLYTGTMYIYVHVEHSVSLSSGTYC